MSLTSSGRPAAGWGAVEADRTSGPEQRSRWRGMHAARVLYGGLPDGLSPDRSDPLTESPPAKRWFILAPARRRGAAVRNLAPLLRSDHKFSTQVVMGTPPRRRLMTYGCSS